MEQKGRLDLGAFSTQKPPCQPHEPKDDLGAVRYHLGAIADLLISCVSCHLRELGTYNLSSGQQHVRCLPGHGQEASKPSSAANSWIIAEREFCTVINWLLEALTPVLSALFCSWAAGKTTCLRVSSPPRVQRDMFTQLLKYLKALDSYPAEVITKCLLIDCYCTVIIL